MKRNFLIVFGDGQAREGLARDLRKEGYSVTLASTGAEAERVVKSVAVDMALISTNLPDSSADKLREAIQQLRPECKVLLLNGLEDLRGAHDQLKYGQGAFLLRREQLIELLCNAFEADNSALGSVPSRRGYQALLDVIDVLVGLRELDDRFFGGSTHNVMLLARAVAEEMSVDEETLREISVATLLRDIGNVALDPELLQYRGNFSEEQSSRMMEHVDSSLRLLEHIDFPWKALPIIRHHHEQYDGSGYPDGLKGREIPIGARIISVVDSYVAMTSDRSHREARDPESAMCELISQAGFLFDPEVVEVFQRVLDKRLSQTNTKRRPRVLIVEPQVDFRKLLKMRLLNEGFAVDETKNSEKAIERILKRAPDIVLADADAEESKPFSILEEIREDESLCRLPFVLLSSKSDRVLMMRALRMGVDDYVSKAIDLEELTARVMNVLTRESIRRKGGSQPRRRGIRGSLEDMALPDLIQTLMIGMKTACVTLQYNGSEGKLWMANGSLSHAQCGELVGEEAFFKLLRWTSGEFVIEHRLKTEESTLAGDTMFLLMEGLRLMDEDQVAAGQSA